MIKRVEEKNKTLGLKKVIKKNQVVLLALALMLMTAGYLNYTNNYENENENILLAGLGDAQLVSANVVTENEVVNDITNQVQNEIIESNEIDENAPTNETNVVENVLEEENNTKVENEEQLVQEASNQAESDDYFTRSKLERETMYSQMLETYTGILENEKISAEQKDIAENEIKNINDTKNAIMVVENLLQTKGFENAVVFVNSPSVNVVIKKDNLMPEEVAQVQNILQRELKTDIENIHITTN